MDVRLERPVAESWRSLPPARRVASRERVRNNWTYDSLTFLVHRGSQASTLLDRLSVDACKVRLAVEAVMVETTASKAAVSPSVETYWAYWPQWWGPRELLTRIIRAAQSGAAELGGDDAPCHISISVAPGEDVETFESLQSLRENATTAAFKHFDAIDVVVGKPSIVTVSLVKRGRSLARRGPPSHPWLDRGVLLTIKPRPGAANHALRVRTEIKRAIDRGSRDVTQYFDGRAETKDEVQANVRQILEERFRVTLETRFLHLSMALGFAFFGPILLTIAFGGPFQRAKDGTFVAGDWYIILLACAALIGWFISPRPVTWTRRVWVPSVWIRDSTIAMRLVRKPAGLILAGIAAVVASVVLAKFGIKGK